MPSNRDKKNRVTSTYEYVYSSFKKEVFDIGDYVQNPPMIRKLKEDHDIAHAYSSKLEDALGIAEKSNFQLQIEIKEKNAKLEDIVYTVEILKGNTDIVNREFEAVKDRLEKLQDKNHKCELDLAKATSKLEDASRNSFIQLLLSVLATVALGFGVNIVTTTPTDWKGWTLVTIGIVLTIAAFFISRKNTK